MKFTMYQQTQAGPKAFAFDTADMSNLNGAQRSTAATQILFVIPFAFGFASLFLLSVFGQDGSPEHSRAWTAQSEWHRWSIVPLLVAFNAAMGLALYRFRAAWPFLKKQMAKDQFFSTYAPYAVLGGATMAGMPVWSVPLMALGVYAMQVRRADIAETIATEPWQFRRRTGLMFAVYAFLYIAPGSYLLFSGAEIAHQANYLPSVEVVARFLVVAALMVVSTYLVVALGIISEAVQHNQEDGVQAVREFLKKEAGTTSKADAERFLREAKHVPDSVVSKRHEGEGSHWVAGFHAAVGYHGKFIIKFAGASMIAQFMLAPFAACWYLAFRSGIGAVMESSLLQTAETKSKMDEVIRGAGAKREEVSQ